MTKWSGEKLCSVEVRNAPAAAMVFLGPNGSEHGLCSASADGSEM